MKKKNLTHSTIVSDVCKNWKQMKGKTNLEKKLNAFITQYFVTGEAPNDECYYLVEKILSLKKITRNKIQKILHASFGSGVYFDDDNKEVKIDLTESMPELKTTLNCGSLSIYLILKMENKLNE